jgi:AcrR family transcriptional regulator
VNPQSTSITLRLEKMKSPRPRGRPPTVDREKLCEVALRLFEKHGFAEVSMDEIAEAAKVSRRTLFRLFPSKGDLVWDELAVVMKGLRERSDDQKEALSLDALVNEVFRPTLKWLELPEVATLARRRLKLILSAPELLNNQVLEQIQREITRAVSGAKDLAAPPELVARSIVAVGFGAMLWWAEQEGEVTAEQAFDSAIKSMASIVRSES